MLLNLKRVYVHMRSFPQAQVGAYEDRKLEAKFIRIFEWARAEGEPDTYGTFLVLRVVASFTEVSVYSLNLTTAMGLGLSIAKQIIDSMKGTDLRRNKAGFSF